MKDFNTCISFFLTYCQFEKNLSSKTIKAYRLDIKQFNKFLITEEHSKIINDIDKHILRKYIQELLKNYKVKTVKRKIATIKALLSYLEFEDIIEVNPFRKIRMKIREDIRLPKLLSLKEITGILETVYSRKHNVNDKNSYAYKIVLRDIIVIELLFCTGLRVSEVCNLMRDNIDIDTGILNVNGKGRRERILSICNHEIIDILKEYDTLLRKGIGTKQYLFLNRDGNRLSEQSVRFMIKKYVQLSKIAKNVTPHMFRHTFATMLLEREVDIRYIQKLLGHSTINTTQIYTHVSQQKQREILATKHPRENLKFKNMIPL